MTLSEYPDSAISELIVQKFNNVESEDFIELFHDSAKLTLDTTKKEGKQDIVRALADASKKYKGPFAISKFNGVEITQNSKIYSGIASWGTNNFVLTVSLEPKTDDNLVITNLMLVVLK